MMSSPCAKLASKLRVYSGLPKYSSIVAGFLRVMSIISNQWFHSYKFLNYYTIPIYYFFRQSDYETFFPFTEDLEIHNSNLLKNIPNELQSGKPINNITKILSK